MGPCHFTPPCLPHMPHRTACLHMPNAAIDPPRRPSKMNMFAKSARVSGAGLCCKRQDGASFGWPRSTASLERRSETPLRQAPVHQMEANRTGPVASSREEQTVLFLPEGYRSTFMPLPAADTVARNGTGCRESEMRGLLWDGRSSDACLVGVGVEKGEDDVGMDESSNQRRFLGSPSSWVLLANTHLQSESARLSLPATEGQ